METKDQVKHAFSPVNCDVVQKNAILKTNMTFTDLGCEIIDLVPPGPHRSTAMRKLLEAKFHCVQAISHHSTVQVTHSEPQAPVAPPVKPAKGKGKNGEKS